MPRVPLRLTLLPVPRLALGIAVVAGLSLGGASRAQALVDVGTVRWQQGDDPRWADPALDDAAWPEIRLVDVPEIGGIAILRARVPLSARNLAPGRPAGLFLAALASCEVAWDGLRINREGRSGRPAPEAAAEIPAPVQAQWAIPDRLATPGEHLLALRCSAHHRGFRPKTGYWTLLVGSYDSLQTLVSADTRIALASLSGMGMVGLFALAMFFADRRDRSFLLLGLVCLCAGALLLAESWRNLFGYSYDRHLARLVALTFLTALFNLALFGFVRVRFPAPFARPMWLALGVCLLAALPLPGWDLKMLAMDFAGLALATAWIARAAWRLERGSLPALLGLAALLTALLGWPRRFADVGFYLALDFLLLCLLVAHALQASRFRREREEALVRSARLEAELLRKHLQPHFLMNTLTALSEWIEREPAVAVGLIDSLAEELRLLARISDRTLIPLEEELALCRTHVEVLSRRRDREYELRVEGGDPRDLVPPAVFHTLVENAITHDASQEGQVVLDLRAMPLGDKVRYVFSAPRGESEAEPVEGSGDEGTGLRYVRARLRESFGSEAAFSAGPAGGAWRTEITIPRRRGR